MNSSWSGSVFALLALVACGKSPRPPTVVPPSATSAPAPTPTSTPTATPTPTSTSAPTAAPTAPPAEPTPAPAIAPAPEPAAVPTPAPAGAPAHPAWWSPLFEAGRVSSWDIKENATTSQAAEDDPREVVTTKSDKVGKLTCKVGAVSVADGKSTAVVECTGYDFEGVEASPGGTWISDGATLWRLEGDAPMLFLDNPPVTKKLGDEDIEIGIAAGEDAGSWCHTEKFMLGDGGVFTACFDASRGPVRFYALGGSAMTTFEMVTTLAK